MPRQPRGKGSRKDVYKRQSLARQHKDEFFEYVNNSALSKVDQLYLLGFYYRINGNPQKSIEKLTDALNKDGSRAQIKRELVNAYISVSYTHLDVYKRQGAW